jgi:type II pantothenate kinase
MFDLSSAKNRNRAEALDHFYNFARRLDSYRVGLKDDKLSIFSRELGGEFHFIHFETRRMQQTMDLVRANNLHLNIHEMGATGGGAHKYAAKWKQELGIEMKKQDELDSLVAGMQFVLRTVVGECYSFRPEKVASDGSSVGAASADGDMLSMDEESYPVGAPVQEDEANLDGGDSPRTDEDRGAGDEWWWSRKVQRDAISHSATFPYLLVTIGTGVSILRVDGPRKYERISGSTIGGGTYWGLIRLLTDLENFEDVMRLAARGDPSKVDMMVGDIYGENSDALEKIGLKANLVASSFGKLVAKEDPAAGLKQEDLARALLLMITNNIGQVAYLNAKLTNTRRIYFVGNFLRENKISQRRLSYAIDYWSKGEMEALFLEHEGYFGALGAFLLSQNIAKEPEAASNRDQRHSVAVPATVGVLREKDPPQHRRNTTIAF